MSVTGMLALGVSNIPMNVLSDGIAWENEPNLTVWPAISSPDQT